MATNGQMVGFELLVTTNLICDFFKFSESFFFHIIAKSPGNINLQENEILNSGQSAWSEAHQAVLQGSPHYHVTQRPLLD